MDLLHTALMLSKITCPSGFEQAALDAIAEIARTYTSDLRRTAAGSLLVHRPGRGRRVLLAAHADTTGFFTTRQEACGVFRFEAFGPADARLLTGMPVVSVRGTRGIIGADFGAEPEKLTLSQLFIDAPGAAPSEAFVPALPADTADGLFYAPFLAPVLSAAVLLDVLAEAPADADVSLVFTAQHMPGARDASAAAFLAAPEFAVTIDAIPARDLPGGDGSVSLRGGVVISHQSGRAIADPALTKALIEAADGPVQHDFAGPAVSNLAAIQRTGAGIPAAAAGFAMRSFGGALSCAAIADAEALSRTLQAFLVHTLSE